MQIRHSPIARVGVNARTWPGNNVRASFGQAFRGPSIAERYTSTVGGGLVIEPNPCLDVEKGWSAELAIRQGFKTGTEKRGIFGYVDIAGFLMRYNSMIEFGVSGTTSNNPLDPGFGPVFSALNISNTRIWGFEVTGLIDARYDDFYVSLSGGVTWLDPRNVNPTPEDKQLNFHYQMTPLETFQELNAWLAPEGNPIKKYDNPSFLKYRNRLTTRATLVLNWRKITLTTNFQSKSRVVNYDQFFNVAIRGASEYWATRRVAYELVDMVLAYQVTKGLTASVNVDNIINREYMILPGIIGKQRNFTVQVKYVF